MRKKKKEPIFGFLSSLAIFQLLPSPAIFRPLLVQDKSRSKILLFLSLQGNKMSIGFAFCRCCWPDATVTEQNKTKQKKTSICFACHLCQPPLRCKKKKQELFACTFCPPPSQGKKEETNNGFAYRCCLLAATIAKQKKIPSSLSIAACYCCRVKRA